LLALLSLPIFLLISQGCTTTPPGTEHNRPLINGRLSRGGVHTLTGSFSAAWTDLAIDGRGPSPLLVRTYNTDEPNVSDLGIGWTHSYEAHLDLGFNGEVLLTVRKLAATRTYRRRTATIPRRAAAAGSEGADTAGPAVAGQVDYGSTALSQAVRARRLADKNIANTYAAGRLESGDIIVGRSSGGLHAEEDVIAQAGGRRIVDLYSEFEPCANKCRAATTGMNVTWSWPWNGIDRGDAEAIRAASQTARNTAIKELFGR